MTEDEAQAWLSANVSRETIVKLARFRDLLLAENEHQNLIAAPSIAQSWARHIVDSVQLARLAPHVHDWLDIGSGPGLPGMPLAIVAGVPVRLIEPRRRRVEFLRRAVGDLGLDKVTVLDGVVEQLAGPVAHAITARAVAALPKLFALAHHLAARSTIWVLPKGKSAETELESARAEWQGEFQLVASVTDPTSRIVVARNVRRRGI